MKIVFYDSKMYDDLDLTEFRSLGDVEIYSVTEDSELLDRIKDADIIVNHTTDIERELIEQLSCKLIALTSTGYDRVDIEACRDNGIMVANVPSYGEHAVAQMTMNHILNLYSGFYELMNSVKNGEWEKAEDFTYWYGNPRELHGKTLGILGYGAIGKSVGRIAESFGMKILPYTSSGDLSLEEVLSESDCITIHLPLTEKTKNLINKDTISHMKEIAFIVNTARGGIVNEQDLADALNSGKIAGCGLDVLTNEPPNANDPLMNSKNTYITPHAAWVAKEARERMIKTTVENIKAFMKGEYINIVNK